MKTWLLGLMLGSSLAFGQSFTAVTATGVQVDNGSGGAINPPSGSNLCFLGVNSAGAAITYTPSGGGPVTGTVCQTLNGSGNLTGSLQVANPATASPAGLRYTITITNGTTTYLTLPIVSLSGALFQFTSYVLPVNGTGSGVGFPHIACTAGATYTSTTLPSGDEAFTCTLVGGVGSWRKYPQGGSYCPAGMGYVTPQINGTPFCISPALAGIGTPSGSCIKNSTYYQQDAPGTVYGCVAGGWVLIAGGGTAGLTSFQSRATPGATLQSTDVVGILHNSPFGLSATQGLLFDAGVGTLQPSANWVFGTGGTAGQLFGYKTFNLAPNSSTSPVASIVAADGSAFFANGQFSIAASGAASWGGGASLTSSSLLCQSSGTNCPAGVTPLYQTMQRSTTGFTPRGKLNFIGSTGFALTDNSGNGSTDVSLSAVPNSALASSSVTINTTGGLTGGGTVALGGTITLNATGGGGSVLSASQNSIYIQPNSGTAAIAGPAALTNNAVTPILQGVGNTDLFASGGGNNGIANFFAAYPTGVAQVPSGSTDTESSSLAIPAGASLVDRRNNSYSVTFHNTGGSTVACGSLTGINALGLCDSQIYDSNQYTTMGHASSFVSASHGFSNGNNGSSAQGWSLFQHYSDYENFLASGIHQHSVTQMNCHAIGDCGAFYLYQASDGGATAASDEGTVGFGVHTGESTSYFHGTISSGGATGSTLLVTSNTSGQNAFTDGSYLLRTSGPSLAGTVVDMAYPMGVNAWDLSGITMPVSTAWGTLQTATTGSANGQFQIPVSQTINVILGTSPASPGPYVVGSACLANNFAEQVQVTAVGSVSAGIQSVTYSTRNGYHAGTVLMQGGMCGHYGVSTTNTWKPATMAIGSFSPTQVVVSGCLDGTCIQGVSAGTSNMLKAEVADVGQGVTFYEGAQIVGTKKGSPNNVELAFNTAAWTNGDTVIDPHPLAVVISAAYFDCNQTTPLNPAAPPCVTDIWDGPATLGTLHGFVYDADVFDVILATNNGNPGNYTNFFDVTTLPANGGAIISTGRAVDLDYNLFKGYANKITNLSLASGGGFQFTQGAVYANLAAANVPPPPTVLGQFPVANVIGFGGVRNYTNVLMSGDATMSQTGLVTFANTSVTPGSYTCGNFTVNTKGLLTTAANGSCSGGGVTSIDTLTGAFTFGGSGVSHIGNAYTFSGGSSTPGGTPGQQQYNNGGAFGGFTQSGDCTTVTSTGITTCAIPPSHITYPTGITNQVQQYLNPTTVGAGGFLASLDLANCSTAYLYDEGTGTLTHNKCATGAAGNGTIIGSPAWSQYGLVLNPQTTGQAVQLPASENTAHTFELVGYFPYFGTNLGVNWGGAVNFPSNQSIICSTASNLICFLNWNSVTGPGGVLPDWLNAQNGGGAGATAASAQPLGTGWHTFAFTCGVAGTSVMQEYIDGTPVLMATTAAMCPTSTGSGIYQIGGSSLLSATWKSMILAGSITYQTERTATQIASDSTALLNYVKSRGQAGNITPAYTALNKSKVGCYGDSRMVSVLGPSPCNYMVLNDTNAQVSVVATSGQLASDLCVTPAYGIQDVMPKVATRSAAIVWIDINDIINGGNNTAQIAGYDSCIIKNLKATGASVLISTEIDATGWDAGKNAIDTYILQMAKQWGADGIVNLNSFPVIGADGAAANLTYFAGGGLHPQITTNQNIIGPAFQNAINELWGSTSLQHNKTASASYQELAQDDYLDLTGTAAQTITLPDCQGYTHERYLYNSSAFTATIVPSTSGFGASFTQTINGGSSFTLPAGASVTIGIVPGAPSTGSCSWQVVSSAGTSGGTGTVTHAAGPLTALSIMLGNGTADSKVDSAATSDGAGTFNLVGLKLAGSQALTGVQGTTGTKALAFTGSATANHLISIDANGNGNDSGIAFYSSSTATLTGGSGVTSVTCATAACTSSRGTLTIVGGTATTGTIVTLAWTATPAAQVCTATLNGGAAFQGIGNSVATTTGMNITAGVSVSGLTITVNYSCQP